MKKLTLLIFLFSFSKFSFSQTSFKDWLIKTDKQYDTVRCNIIYNYKSMLFISEGKDTHRVEKSDVYKYSFNGLVQEVINEKDNFSVSSKKQSNNYYSYEEPSYYLERAGKLGTNKHIVAFFGGAFTAILVSSKTASQNSIIGCGLVFGVTYLIMDISSSNNIKKAGLSLRERNNFKASIAPGGVKICYTF